MEIKEEMEDGKHNGIRKPLLGEHNNQLVNASKDHHYPWMLYFTTFIAVCGSYEFGACVSLYSDLHMKNQQKQKINYFIQFLLFLFFQTGYSSPAQDAIRRDLNLSLEEVSQ